MDAETDRPKSQSGPTRCPVCTVESVPQGFVLGPLLFKVFTLMEWTQSLSLIILSACIQTTDTHKKVQYARKKVGSLAMYCRK